MPDWINHIAFDVADLEALTVATERWQRFGIDVVELDHEWCRSIYASDPNDVLVEFCCTTRAFTDDEIEAAAVVLAEGTPELGDMPPIKVYPAMVRENAR